MSENVNLPSGATAAVEKGVERKTLDALDEAAVCLMKAMDAVNPFLPKGPQNALNAANKPSMIALEAAKEAFFESKSMATHAEIIQGAIDASLKDYVKREGVIPLLTATSDVATNRCICSVCAQIRAAYKLANEKGLLA